MHEYFREMEPGLTKHWRNFWELILLYNVRIAEPAEV
jgi:hypothetical protein